ncbi:MAG: hypothetical protein JWO50_315 [Candidatus Kaiserbacteria bacterium]|nr:hypothetical protein [Candidatus Kaiserbacteria bacterium]
MVPLVVVGIVLGVGEIFLTIDPLRDYSCDFLRNYGNCMDIIGFPTFEFGKWCLGVGVIMLFVPVRITKIWAIFASIYLVIAAYMISTVSPDAFPFNNISAAWFLGAIFLAATILWVVVHGAVILLGRKRK